jgi:hypothetical protein
MTTSPISLHLSETTLEHLAERQRETGQTAEQLAEQLIEEGLRMRRYRAIYFQDGQTGRRARLLGGPDVWEAISAIRPIDRENLPSAAEAADWFELPVWQMRDALAYYAEFADEIDERIAANDRAYDEGYAAWRAAQEPSPR